MAKIPNIDRAIVDPRKITHYLLDETHRVGGAKARLLIAFGFSPKSPDELIAALRQHGQSYEATTSPPNQHGVKFVVRGLLQTPDRRSLRFRTVWIIDTGTDIPRFVSAVPE